jgi:hypothetical protein
LCSGAVVSIFAASVASLAMAVSRFSVP